MKTPEEFLLEYYTTPLERKLIREILDLKKTNPDDRGSLIELMEACGFLQCGYFDDKVVTVFGRLCYGPKQVKTTDTHKDHIVLDGMSEPISIVSSDLLFFLMPVKPMCLQTCLIKEIAIKSFKNEYGF